MGDAEEAKTSGTGMADGADEPAAVECQRFVAAAVGVLHLSALVIPWKPERVAASTIYCQPAPLRPGSTRALQASWHARITPAERMELRSRISAAKVSNYAGWIATEGTGADRALVRELDSAARSAAQCDVIHRCVGYEALADARAFQWLNSQVRDDLKPWFSAPYRMMRGRDRLNSLLLSAWSFLDRRIRRSIEAQGLNPDLGIEGRRYGILYPLAVEHQLVVQAQLDRTVLQVINNGDIPPSELDDTCGMVSVGAMDTLKKAVEREFFDRSAESGWAIALEMQIRSFRAMIAGQSEWWLVGWQRPGRRMEIVDCAGGRARPESWQSVQIPLDLEYLGVRRPPPNR